MENKMNNKLTHYQRQLLKYLGKDYTVNVIDGAECVYRDLGDYDVEIIGGRTKRGKFHIFVWKKDRMEIVERIFDIPHEFVIMEVLLNRIALRYKCREAE